LRNLGAQASDPRRYVAELLNHVQRVTLDVVSMAAHFCVDALR